MILKHRRGTTLEWQELDLVVTPEDGELVIEECIDGTRKCKIGNGSARFSKLPYIDDKVRADLLLELANVDASIRNRLAVLNENFLAELNTVENSIKALTNKYSDLITDYTAKDAEIRVSLNKKFDETIELLRNELEAVNEHSKDSQTDLRNEIAQVEAQVLLAENKFKAGLADNASSFKSACSELTQDYRANDNKIKALLTENINETTDQLRAEIAALAESSVNTDEELRTEVVNIEVHLDSAIKSFNKAITDLSNDFNIRCRELTTDYTSRDANLSAELTKSIDDATEILANEISTVEKLSKNIQTSLQNEIAHIELSLETTKLDLNKALTVTTSNFITKCNELTNDYISRDANLKAILDTNLTEAVEGLTAEIANITTNLNQVHVETQSEASRINAKINSLEGTFVNSLASLRDEFESKQAEFASDYTARDSAIKAVLTEQVSATADIIREEIEAVSSASTEAQLSLQAEVRATATKISGIEQEFKTALIANSQSLTALHNELTAAYLTGDATTKAVLAQDIAEATTTLKSDISAAAQTAQESLQAEVQSINTRITTLEDNYVTTLTNSLNNFKAIRSELTADYISRDENLKALFNKNLADTEELLTNKIDTITEYANELQLSIQNEIAQVTTRIDTTEAAFKTLLAETAANFTANCDALTKDYISRDANIAAIAAQNLAEITEVLQGEIVSTLSQVDEIKSDLQEESSRLSAKIASVEETFVTNLADTLNKFEARYTELANDYIARDDNIEAVLSQNLAQAVELLTTEINTRTNNIQSALIDETTQINETISAVDKKFTTDIMNYSQNFDSRLQEATADYVTRDANLKAILTQGISATADQLHLEIKAVSDALKATQENFQNSITELNTDLAANKETFKTALASQSATFDNKLQEATADYVTRDANLRVVIGEDISNNMSELTADYTAKFENAQADIAELGTQLTNLNVDINSLSNRTSEAIQELTSHVDAVASDLTKDYMLRDANTKAILTNDLAEAVELLNSEITSVSNYSEETRANLLFETARLDNQIKIAQADFDAALETQTNSFTATCSEIERDYIARDANTKAILEKSISELEAGLTNEKSERTEALKDLSKQMDDKLVRVNTNLTAQLEGLEEEITDKFAEFGETLLDSSPIADGLRYENNELWLTCKGEQIGNSVTITGGSGGGGSSYSVVTVTNNLPSDSFTVSKNTEAWINFIYTSFRNEVQTSGDGTCSVTINGDNIPDLYCKVQHGIAKPLEVTKYLKDGVNQVVVTCMDRYGTTESLAFTFNVVELRIESTFNSAQIFNTNITFRYKVFGQSEKTAYVLLDGNKIHEQNFDENQTGNTTETTVTIPKQAHGCHKITAYVKATASDGSDIKSNELGYEIICTEAGNKTALLTASLEAKEVTQGDLVSIPYMVYDDDENPAMVNLNVYTKVDGIPTKIDEYCTTRFVDQTQQFWDTRQYPIGTVIFEISYTFDYYGESRTISKSYEIFVKKLSVNVIPETDSLQLYLTAAGKSNEVQNPGAWSFTRTYLDVDGKEVEETITTSFENFNWCSNGWFPDSNGDTCLRLNGDARAEIDFKPFENDFKANGKTIEFEFVVRDVNNREAIVIDCFEAEVDQETGKETGKGIGFRATPDKAFLKSSDTEVSCRYKDNERVRVAISVEASDTASQFVSIYLDGILSGVQHYTESTSFNQSSRPQKIKLGSPYCGLDIYNIRVYDKALSTAKILTNYIADQTVPSVKQQLLTDNNILDENGKVSYERVKELGQIPIITFTGSMPTYKGDKKIVTMDFENPLDKARSFSKVYGGPIQVEIDVQGTSSQFYIRKNWKIKLKKKDKNDNIIFDNAAYQHMEGQIPAKVFCIKVDYAEATGTHNTGTANYVETFYDRDEVTLPPQKTDERVRTTIAGFPCIIFEKATEDSEPVFSSKGNFNYDKDAEEAFGFTKDYEDYGVECWEFKNNTSDAVNFVGAIPDNWLDDFEPRYTTANFDRIEELQELSNKAEAGDATITPEQQDELTLIRAAAIANFKEMHDWVVSTATFGLEPVLDDNGEVISTKKIPLSAEERQARLNKFKAEFEDHFNMHYSSIYYVYTFFALMVDQRAKNLFLTRWKEDDGVFRWYPYFYDNDTIFGINNEGALVFDYFHEDTDQLGSSNVYNGQNSVLWNNFRECFQKEIQETYAKLRSEGKLSYNALIDSYVTKGSDKWSAAIYNADADYKYVSMAREQVDHTDEEGNSVTGLDTSNLYQVRGPGEHHLRYFASNRLNYCDSKWNAGEYPSDFFFLRIYTPQLAEINDEMSETKKEELRQSNARIKASLEAVPANPNITVTPFSDMYAGVKYKANGTLKQERLAANESHEFTPPSANEVFNDTETAIYGASSLASLGDLSGLYCGVINLVGKNSSDSSAVQGNVKENKLIELIIGNESKDYHNDNFKEIEVGTCRLLQKIDLRNCSGLGIAGANPQKTLNLTGCPNIEEIYAEGTNLTLVELPDGGYVKTLHLPASINTLVIKNQRYISDFKIESYANIRKLQIENSNLDTTSLLENCRNANRKYTVVNVSLTDVQLGSKENPVTADFIKSLFAVYDDKGALVSGIRGLDDAKQAYIKGTCYIENLSGEDYTTIKSHYKDLTVNFGSMTSKVTFEYNGSTKSTEVYGENSTAGEVTEDKLAELAMNPTWPENDAFTYTFISWSEKKQEYREIGETGWEDYESEAFLKEHYPDVFNGSALKNIKGNRTLYPVFKAIRKTYKVTFINPTAPEETRFLAEVDTLYGRDADYFAAKPTPTTPTKQDAASPELYTFVGWEPKPEKITGTLTCYAQFTVNDSKWYQIGLGDISNCVGPNGVLFDGYTLDGLNNTMAITECTNNFNAAIIIPSEFAINMNTYTVTKLGGFSNHDKLELVRLPETLVELLANAFSSCINLNEIVLPQSLQKIGDRALNFCTKLQEIIIPKNVTYISDAAISECVNLKKITVEEGNTRYKIIQGCLVDCANKRLIQGTADGIIPQDGSIEYLGANCFARMPMTSIKIPDSITDISDNAFSRCANLTSVELSSKIRTLGATCFAWCSSLSEINLPEGLKDILTYVFYLCPLEEVVIPSTVNNILDRAFCDTPNLKTVTFKKALEADGVTVKVPFIHSGSFYGTGKADAPVVFNCPWSEAQHKARFEGIDGEGKEKDPAFGANYYSFNFDYEEEIN